MWFHLYAWVGAVNLNLSCNSLLKFVNFDIWVMLLLPGFYLFLYVCVTVSLMTDAWCSLMLEICSTRRKNSEVSNLLKSFTVTLKSASRDNSCTVGGDGGCRVGEVRASTTSPMPDHKGFKLQ